MAVPQTSNSASASYIPPIEVFDFYAQSLIADMLRPKDTTPRPSFLAMIDPSSKPGKKFIVHCNRGAGEIEAACAVASRYTPLDLQALTGVSQTLLKAINAARTLWSLYMVLKPGTARPQDCPGAVESNLMLTELRDGAKIFTFIESEQAGLVHVQAAQPRQLLPGQGTVVERCVRLFPNYGLNRGRTQG